MKADKTETEWRAEISALWESMWDAWQESYELEKRMQAARNRRQEMEGKILDAVEVHMIAGCGICTTNSRVERMRHREDCLAKVRRFVRGEIDIDGNEKEKGA